MVIWPSFSAGVIAAIRDSIRLTMGSRGRGARSTLTRSSAFSIPFRPREWQGLAMGPNRSDHGMKEEKGAGLLRQLGMMFRALLASPVRNTLFVLGGAIFVVIAATAYGQIRLNRWNQPFYDALARRDFDSFVEQLGVFVVITSALLVLNVGQRWLSEMLKLKLREGLVQDLVGEWLKPHRAFLLAQVGPVGVNPDQRMHEDARHLTELSSDLGVELLQASILLVTFVNILWRISG